MGEKKRSDESANALFSIAKMLKDDVNDDDDV